MPRLRKVVLAAFALLVGFGMPASAVELTADDRHNAMIYTWDNAVFTLYHEIGHMLIDLYQLPVLAKEEDGVDNLATLMALEDYKRDDDPIILDAAYGWVAWMRRDDIAGMSQSDFFDEHSISTQRAFQMICVLVGSDKAEFGEIATRFGLSDQRQDRCAGEFAQTKRSWDAVMAPHRTANEGEPRVTVSYGAAGAATKTSRDILVENEVLETVAATIEGLYTLPEPIELIAADCGVVNAFYAPGARTITLCYEIVQQYYDQYTGDIRNGIDPEEVDIAAVQASASSEPGKADEPAGPVAEAEGASQTAVPAGNGFSIRSTWSTPKP